MTDNSKKAMSNRVKKDFDTYLVMDTLLPWQQRHVLIALLFEVVGTSYLVQRSIEATATCGMICCYGPLVTMATEECAYSFTV